MIKLLSIYREMEKQDSYKVLYDLHSEVEPVEAISHKKMPPFEQHKAFVSSKPYQYWYFIYAGENIVGSILLTHEHKPRTNPNVRYREVGIRIFKKYQHMGFGSDAIQELRRLHPGRMLANINPENKNSQRFFKKLGAKPLQVTYELP